MCVKFENKNGIRNILHSDVYVCVEIHLSHLFSIFSKVSKEILHKTYASQYTYTRLALNVRSMVLFNNLVSEVGFYSTIYVVYTKSYEIFFVLYDKT